MSVVGLLAPNHPVGERHIRDRLTYWREHLLEHKRGESNPILTIAEIRRELDRWLDELNALTEKDKLGL